MEFRTSESPKLTVRINKCNINEILIDIQLASNHGNHSHLKLPSHVTSTQHHYSYKVPPKKTHKNKPLDFWGQRSVCRNLLRTDLFCAIKMKCENCLPFLRRWNMMRESEFPNKNPPTTAVGVWSSDTHAAAIALVASP